MPRSFILYQPPYGGQSMRTRNIMQAWEAVAGFLATCTDAAFPRCAQLVLFEDIGKESPYCVEPYLKGLTARFGPAERRRWSSGVRDDYCYEWPLSGEQIEQARDFIHTQPWPRRTLGPVQLQLSAYFRWVAPPTRTLLPFQEPECLVPCWQPQSHLLAFLGPSNAAILEGRFPFESADAAFRGYLKRMKPVAPVRLLDHYFRLLIPNKRGTDYVVRKLDPSSLDGI